MTTKEILTALKDGIAANHQNRCREGNIINLKGKGEVIMTGDLHGHDINFDRLVRYSQLDKHPRRHLIIHELLHCADGDIPHQCHSYNLVARAAQLKTQFPHQVHYLMGNHAMAQVTGSEVLKNGQPMVRSLRAGIFAAFSQNSDIITRTLAEFIISLPLAARTANRIWMSHSLPSLRNLKNFDQTIFDKPLTLEDIQINPAIHALLWDRCHSEECLEKLRQMWQMDMFIVGHQPQTKGFARPLERLIILASDHNHGCFLHFKLGKSYEPDELCQLIKPLASIP